MGREIVLSQGTGRIDLPVRDPEIPVPEDEFTLVIQDNGIGFDNRGLVTGFRSKVTEPGALALLGLGLAGLLLSRRRRPS